VSRCDEPSRIGLITTDGFTQLAIFSSNMATPVLAEHRCVNSERERERERRSGEEENPRRVLLSVCAAD